MVHLRCRGIQVCLAPSRRLEQAGEAPWVYRHITSGRRANPKAVVRQPTKAFSTRVCVLWCACQGQYQSAGPDRLACKAANTDGRSSLRSPTALLRAGPGRAAGGIAPRSRSSSFMLTCAASIQAVPWADRQLPTRDWSSSAGFMPYTDPGFRAALFRPAIELSPNPCAQAKGLHTHQRASGSGDRDDGSTGTL